MGRKIYVVDGQIAIKIKSTDEIKPQQLKGLKGFEEDFSLRKVANSLILQ